VTTTHAPWIPHSDGVTTIDAEYFRPGFASVHVLERDGHAALIDTGANSSVPLVLRALTALGIPVETIEYLFLTHVHLDHAGGAGSLLAALPHARVIVHPRGAAHLVDPTRLEAATIAVYGEQAFKKLYGALVPIPADRITQTADGQALPFGRHELRILHTPGHALHHQVLFEPETRALFSGDTFGVSYRELDTEAGAFVVPTTTPTQFDPRQLLASIRRIVELAPESVYLTHFGRVKGVARLATALSEQIERFVELAREHATHEQRHARIRSALHDYLVERATVHGIPQPSATVDAVLGPDLELNAQGLVAWLERAEKRPG
jgi:glyoxylase-like metal-dependent hydrolase (beta-lactamase superfamily II)